MSFLGGAECSTAGNPLTQFTKHVQDDRSLQRDRLVGRGPGGANESFRSTQIPGQQDHIMDDFLNQQPNFLPPQDHAPSPFSMQQMRNELSTIPTNQPQQSDNWAAQYHPHMQSRPGFETKVGNSSDGFSTSDFQNFQQATNHERIAANTSPAGAYHGPTLRANGYHGAGLGANMMNTQMMRQQFQMQQQQRMGMNSAAAQQQSDKGKGRMVELDDKNWEEQFARIDAEGRATDGKVAEDSVERELNDMDRSVSETNHDGDFEAVWRGIQAEQAEKDSSRLADGEFSSTVRGETAGARAEFDDFLDTDSFDVEHALKNLPPIGSLGHGLSTLPDNYLFEEDNLFQDVGDPFREGQRIMNEGDNLSLAVLAFEETVQRDPSHVAAWTLLGSAQAQNEKETPAIRALEQAINLDASNLDALMGLAVSYTNEGYDSTAYRTLERWLSTKYPSLLPEVSTPGEMGFTDRANLHEKLTTLFIRAAQLSPSGEQMDPDVQVGLGVLFYGAEEYEKAVDCFSAALASTEAGTTNQRQQVHLLWNRLGATLANSGRSEEAIAAYEKALTLRPNFVRARYNLGVSCINIGCFEEAAQHLLGALAMHEKVFREGSERARQVVGKDITDAELNVLLQQNQSTNLYDTLRRVFSQMERKDLVERVGPTMDIASFRGEFEF